MTDKRLVEVQIMKDRPKGRRTKKRIAEDEAIEAWLISLIEDPQTHIFVMCRDLGHPKRVEKMWGVPTFYRRKLSCPCGMSYEQNVHNGRVVWKGNLSYPTGYLKPKDAPAGLINRDVWRHLSAQLIEFDTDMPPGMEELLEMMVD